MSTPAASPPAKPEEQRLAPSNLPPVEAPTGTFILQLFLIPLLIVSVVVLLWLLFSWVAHLGRDNATDLAAAIERGDNWSGQRAYELADLLRSSDPHYEPLRRDSALATRLAAFLTQETSTPASRQDWRGVMRRMYLCRALGAFKVLDGLPALLAAAEQERDSVEVEVRFSALEAIASLADNCGPEKLRENAKAIEVILEASRAQDDAATPAPPPSDDGRPTLYRPKSELRAVAAYCLGVIGGEEATKRLRLMLHDAYANARFNAATGLARQGDPACIGVLREMLDPASEAAIRDERYADDRARKQTTVLMNGIKATLLFAENSSTADLAPLKDALQQLASSPLENVLIDRSKIKTAATEALRLLDKH